MAGDSSREFTIQSLLDSGAIISHKDGNYDSNYPRTEEFGDTGVPFLTAKSLSNGYVDIASAPRLADERAESLRFGFVRTGDVLLSHNATIGRVAIVPEYPDRLLIGTSLTYYRLDPQRILSRFFAACLSGKAFQDQLTGAMSHSTRNQVPITAQRKLRVVIPTLPEQRAIAGVLGALDDKIELNRRTSRTLEKLARAIFRAWFVDFEPVKAKAAGARSFPSMPQETFDALPTRLVPSELGPIPEGWSVGRVADFGDVICGKTPPTKNPENYADDVPFITIPDMHNQVFVTDTGKKLSHTGANTQAKKFIPAKSICVSCIATAGLVVITSARAQTNQQINTVIPRKGISPYYCYEALSLLGDEIRAGGSGGSVLHNLNKSNFSALNVLLPMKDVLSHFDGVLSPLFETILANQKESRKLAEMRDYLLPKLLSGEVRVADAELFLEKTTS